MGGGENTMSGTDTPLRFISGGSCRITVGKAYPAGKAGYGEIICVSEGSLCICEDWYEYTVGAGEVLLLDSSKRHYGARETDNDASFYRVIYTGSHKLAQLAGAAEKIFTPAHPERISDITSMMTSYSSQPEYPEEMMNSLLTMLLIELFVHGLSHDDSSASRLCGRICDIILAKNGSVRASEVAAEVGYSADYITRVFRGFYSRGLKAYIDDVRMLSIKNMLGRGLSTAEIAGEAGFLSVRAMRDFFRYKSGESISAYINE